MATCNIRAFLGDDTYGYLEAGLPADLVLLDFTQPQLRSSRYLITSIVSRITPADVLLTMRREVLYQSDRAMRNL